MYFLFNPILSISLTQVKAIYAPGATLSYDLDFLDQNVRTTSDIARFLVIFLVCFEVLKQVYCLLGALFTSGISGWTMFTSDISSWTVMDRLYCKKYRQWG